MLGMRRVMVAARRSLFAMETNGVAPPASENKRTGLADQLDIHRGGSGEPLVLIHGIGHTWRGWKPMLPGLEQRFDVLAMDLPGYGYSPPLPAGTPPFPEQLADAVEAAMDEAGFDQPLVAGNSLGGWIALILARRGRARAAVGISPAGLFMPREARWAAGVLNFMRAAAGGSVPDAVLRNPIGRTIMAGPGVAKPWHMDPDAMQEQARLFANAPSFDATLEGAEHRQVEGLPDIEVPVLLLWGTRDVILLPRQGRRFERLIPNAELKYLKGLGHVPMSDDPDLLVREIAAFANRTAPVPAATGS
jgi:pimeloyl-ACP methyl ester carboxylesterase